MNENEITVEKVVNMGAEKGIFFDTDTMLLTRKEVVDWYHRLKS